MAELGNTIGSGDHTLPWWLARKCGFVIVVMTIALSNADAVASGDIVPRSFGPQTAQTIALSTGEAPGTVIVSAADRTLDLILGEGHALRYRIAVGRDGFGWAGVVFVGRKAEWPVWRPPPEMRERDQSLPELVPPGPLNPLGARAIYLFKDGQDTLYRIHGTNAAQSVGTAVTSGCFRMTNADVLDLYQRIKVGAKVIVR